MESAITIYEINQDLHDNDLDYLLDMEKDNICFFRFTGGNRSETESIVKKLFRLKESNILLFVIFRFPFRFEGKSRMDAAIEQYFNLKEISDAIIYFYSDGMMDMLDESTSIKDAKRQFDQFEQVPIQAIREMLHQTGDINIDVQDLKSFIHNKPGSLFVRTFEGHSFDQPLRDLISAPYLSKNYTEGSQIIINIGYTQDVDMNTFRQINLRLNDLFHKTEIFKLGSHFLNESETKLKVTLIVNGISDPYPPLENKKPMRLYQYKIMKQLERFTRGLSSAVKRNPNSSQKNMTGKFDKI
ncbi:cell division protein FtsZ [Evansella sp. AB-rgal1]|uniref:cell division protein FtsZ n=1 Tax=Evansella sp. AB-rgal1 TaxID=3242696 RepID=UPI00359DB181